MMLKIETEFGRAAGTISERESWFAFVLGLVREY